MGKIPEMSSGSADAVMVTECKFQIFKLLGRSEGVNKFIHTHVFGILLHNLTRWMSRGLNHEKLLA